MEERRCLLSSGPDDITAIPAEDEISVDNCRRRATQQQPVIIEHNKINPENLLSAKYESLDYDTVENCIQEREAAKTVNSWHVTKVSFCRWLVAFLVGIFTGSIAAFIDYCVETGSAWKYSSIKTYVDKCVGENCMFAPLLIWVGYNAAFVLVASFLVAVVEPCAAGSGIPQIKCYLNGVKVPNVVRIKTLVSKVIGVVGAVVGGLAVGKEGPMIHSGAVVAAGVSQGRSTSLGFDLRIFEFFRTDQEKRDFVSGGAAAGVAAAFGAPVGGMLFSLEEGASFWNQGLTWRIFFSAIVSTFSLNVWRSYIKGNPWQLSSPGLINFGRFEDMSYKIWEIGLFALMGCIGGILGAIFNVINQKLTLFRNRYMYNKFVQMFEAVTVAVITATVGFLSIYVNNDCKPQTENTNEMQVQFFCLDGHDSSSTNLFFDTPESSVRRLFHEPAGSFEMVTLAAYTTLYFFLALWTYGLSVPSGLFIPSLLIGAGWGRLAGQSLQWLLPGFQISPGKYALIGAAAQLGGIVRMTVSLTVIIMEATGNISLGLCIMIALICAKWMGDFVGKKMGCEHGIYDMHVHLSSVPILDWEPAAPTSTIHAREVMSHPVTVFRMREKVGRIVDILKKEIHNGFPVVDEFDVDQLLQSTDSTHQTFGRFRGTILRHQLIVLLKRKVWLENPEYAQLQQTLTTADFRDNYPRYPPIHHISISALERDYTVDLEPYMNTSPYTVHETASFPRIFRLFRGLGLRHLVVINSDSEVLGMVTRKDLARYKVTHHGGEMRMEEKMISHGVISSE
ncbi:LOW QUALITY PROTEIN: H(+)/Cl(-) exchange transporter 7-like [Babylonia areolata]|uniref:LOW QUALITY PROTEIN: H(+)/Cl(-) exchange transporter 7-like n=1 Tax=Babylonia areolata TaxID=304850 RepID=UPI003FD5179C